MFRVFRTRTFYRPQTGSAATTASSPKAHLAFPDRQIAVAHRKRNRTPLVKQVTTFCLRVYVPRIAVRLLLLCFTRLSSACPLHPPFGLTAGHLYSTRAGAWGLKCRTRAFTLMARPREHVPELGTRGV